MNYLDKIIQTKRQEVELLKANFTYKDYMERELFQRESIPFVKQFEDDFGIIAEFKRKSPSAGLLIQSKTVEEYVKNYELKGAKALSILTDFHYFGGSIADIQTVRSKTSLPILRKEFIIDEIQLFESKAIGADAILLIASVLDKSLAHHLTILAKSLGLEVVFEIHTQEDLSKINDEVDCVLINNRDLKRQVTDISISTYFSDLIPKNIPSISASGIKTFEELKYLESIGYCGALIGESIIRNDQLHELTLKTALL